MSMPLTSADVNQGRVSIGHIGTMRDNPDRYALLMMNDILGGGGFSSRLMTRIRSDEGLAYSASSSFGLGVYYDGLFQVGFQSRSETVARAAAIVVEEVERIRSGQVTEDELQDLEGVVHRDVYAQFFQCGVDGQSVRQRRVYRPRPGLSTAVS